MKSSKQGMWKGYYLSIEGVQKEYLFGQKCRYVKTVRVAQGEASPYKTLLCTPLPPALALETMQTALGHQYFRLFFNPSPTNAFWR